MSNQGTKRTAGGFDNLPPGEKPNWKKMKEEKKNLKEARKKAEKGVEVYSLQREAKHIWEDLRRKDCTGSRQWDLSLALYDLIKDRLPEMVATHDMSRVVETLVVKGQPQVKDAILQICTKAAHYAWTKYANHVVLKTVVNGTPEQKKLAYKILMPYFCRMMAEPRSRELAEVVFDGVNTEQHRMKCIHLLYGQAYRVARLLMKPDQPVIPAAEWGTTSGSNLNEMKTEFRRVFEEMFSRSDPVPLKYHYVHFFLGQYMSICTTAEKEEIVQELKIRENILDFVQTKSGANLIMEMFWNSDTKARKAMVKSLKGKVTEIANKQFSHQFLFAVLDSLDDTTLTSKVIVTELVRNISLVMGTIYGRKVIRYLVERRNKTDFSPTQLFALARADTNPYSKKDQIVRFKEIRAGANDDLLNAVIEHAGAWVKNSQCASVVGSILMKCEGPKLELAINEVVRQLTTQPPFMAIQIGGTFMMTKKMIGHIGQIELVKSVEKSVPNMNQNEPNLPEPHGMFTRALVGSFTKKIIEDWLESPQGCGVLQAILQAWDAPDIRDKLFDKIKQCPYLEILEKEKAEVKSKQNLFEILSYLRSGFTHHLDKRRKPKDKLQELMECETLHSPAADVVRPLRSQNARTGQ